MSQQRIWEKHFLKKLQKIKVFYDDNEFSRMYPGKKEYVSVKTTDTKRIHEQKRLLVVNLKQLYSGFKVH
jgi:hypothetical protein